MAGGSGGSGRAAGGGVSSNSSGRRGVGEEETVCRGISFGCLLFFVIDRTDFLVVVFSCPTGHFVVTSICPSLDVWPGNSTN